MRRSLIIAALAAFPVSLHAQLRAEGIPLRSGDLERLNPARLVSDREEEMSLEQSQLDALDSLRQTFDREAKRLADEVKRNQRAITIAPPLLRRPPDDRPTTRKDSLERAALDSTNRLKRDRYFEEVTAGRRDLAVALLSLKELFDAHAAAAKEVLTPGQRTAAVLLLDRAAEELTRRLRRANIR